MPVTTRRQQAAVGDGTQQPAASQAHHDTSRRQAKEADDAAKEQKFIEDVIGTGAERHWHACMADALCMCISCMQTERARRACMSYAERASAC